jgi:predicted nucleic acid-binding protein
MYYFDTSALVKVYVKESGSDAVLETIKKASPVVTSILAHPEVLSALARLHRHEVISKLEWSALRRQFERDWSFWRPTPLNEDVRHEAASFLTAFPLRASDAVHLASAWLLGEKLNAAVTFVSSDERLLAAADEAGFVTFAP